MKTIELIQNKKTRAEKSNFQKHRKVIKSEIVKIAVIPLNMLVKPKMIHLKIKHAGIT